MELKVKIINGKNCPYVIVRGNNSGIFAGFLISEVNQSIELRECTRLWKWDGAASISQLAVTGPLKPDNCKFSIETPIHFILDVIEIIPTSDEAFLVIKNTPKWKIE